MCYFMVSTPTIFQISTPQSAIPQPVYPSIASKACSYRNCYKRCCTFFLTPCALYLAPCTFHQSPLSPVFHQSFRMGEKQRQHISAPYAAQSTGEKGGLTERLAIVYPGGFCRNADGDRVPGVAGEAARR